MKIMVLRVFRFTFALVVASVGTAAADPTPHAQLKQSFDQERPARLASQYANPYPAPSGETQLWGRLNHSIAAVANGSPVDTANLRVALENHSTQLKQLPIIGHDGGDLIWPLLVRLYFLGRSKPGSLGDAEQVLVDHMFYIVTRTSGFTGYDLNGSEFATKPLDTWKWHNDSENKIIAKQSSYLLILQALAMLPAYTTRNLENGLTVAAAYEKWRTHWHHYLDERIKRGLLIEVGSVTYSKYSLAAFVNLHDFPSDPELRRKAMHVLDLIFATAATETLPNGVRAGSKSRKYELGDVGIEPFGAFFGKMYLTTTNSVARQSMAPAFLSSSYFPAEVVTSLWNEASASSAYELQARLPGVLLTGTRHLDPEKAVYHYTYMTPAYALGSTNTDLREVNGSTSSEARFASLFVSESPDSRGAAPTISFSPGARSCFDRSVTAQYKNVLVYQNNYQFWKHGVNGRINGLGCYGDAASGSIANLYTDRRWPGGALSDTFLWADRWARTDYENYDTTEHHADLLFASTFAFEASDTALVLTSPEGKVFVWVKPLIGSFRVMDGYNASTKNREASFRQKNAYLDTDKFTPVVVVVAPASNYGGSKSQFMNEMNFMNRISYADSTVTVEPSFRSQLEPGDIFVDSKAAVRAGTWTKVSGRGDHEGESWQAVEAGAKLSLTFQVPSTGNYYVRARVGAKPGRNFMVSLDEKPAQAWTYGIESRAWATVPVEAGGHLVRLLVGTHTLELTAGEAGATFDAVAFLYKRDKKPLPMQFNEFLDNSRPTRIVNDETIHQNSAFSGYTFMSPFVKSRRDLGIWELNHRGKSLIIAP